MMKPEDGAYHKIWLAVQEDDELTAMVRSRQLHIYRNGKKIMILAGKAAPKILDPKDVIVKIMLSSICTSDLHFFVTCHWKCRYKLQNAILNVRCFARRQLSWLFAIMPPVG